MLTYAVIQVEDDEPKEVQLNAASVMSSKVRGGGVTLSGGGAHAASATHPSRAAAAPPSGGGDLLAGVWLCRRN
jgi:hypothetical protein